MSPCPRPPLCKWQNVRRLLWSHSQPMEVMTRNGTCNHRTYKCMQSHPPVWGVGCAGFGQSPNHLSISTANGSHFTNLQQFRYVNHKHTHTQPFKSVCANGKEGGRKTTRWKTIQPLLARLNQSMFTRESSLGHNRIQFDVVNCMARPPQLSL